MPDSFNPADLLAELKADPTLGNEPSGPPMSADIDELEAKAKPRKYSGFGADDLDLTAEEIFRLGVPVESVEDEEARKKAEKEARALAAAERVLDRWTVRAAGHRLLDRIDREAKEPGMPWPGCKPGWPPQRKDRKVGHLTPSANGKRRAWKALWELLGPPRSDWMAILVGRTGRGKSGWALTVAEAVAASGAPVLILSCEMGADELVARLLAIRADPFERGGAHPPAWRDVLRGGVAPTDLADALESACTACPNLYLWAPTHHERTPDHLAGMVRNVTRKHGRAPLVVLDYVQRLAVGEDRRTAVVELSGKLRDMT